MSQQWTPTDMPDLSGRVAVVTGANVGLGYESSALLASKGATVIMAIRTVRKGEDAAAEIRAHYPDAKLVVMRLDLADLSSVRDFTEAFNAQYDRLDILLNNAGVMATPQNTTKDGFELQFGTNHLGHFALTGLLMPRLLATADSRVVNVSSIAAENGKMNFDNLMHKDDYNRFNVYGQSKLSNLLFTIALQKRLEAAGAGTIAVAAHPGVAATNLVNSMRIPGAGLLLKLLSPFTASAHEGALPQVRAAVEAGVEGSSYYGPARRMRGEPVEVEMPPHVNMDDAERLWQVSEELTGITYDFGVAVAADGA